MSVSAGNMFPKGDVTSTLPAVGEHELILYSLGKDGNLDQWQAIFDGVPFNVDAEGFDFSAATISLGFYTPVEGSKGSVTVNSITPYAPEKGFEGDWLSVADGSVIADATVTNDKMYLDYKFNLHETGLKVEFTIHEVPGYADENKNAGWIGFFVSDSYGSVDGYGTSRGVDGFQFLFSGATRNTDSSEQSYLEMAAVAFNGVLYPKGGIYSPKPVVGKHELVLYSAGKSGNLDAWVCMLDGVAFDPDSEGFDFTEAVLSIGVYNAKEGTSGSITIDKVSGYKPGDGEKPTVIEPFSAAFETPIDLNNGMAQIILDIEQVAGYHSTDSSVLNGEEGGKDTWVTVTFGQSMDDAYEWGTQGKKTIAYMMRAHSPGNFYGQNWYNGYNPGFSGLFNVSDGKLTYWLEATEEYTRLYVNGYIVVHTTDITLADFEDGKCYISINEHYGGGIKQGWKYTVTEPSLFNRAEVNVTGEWSTAAELNGMTSDTVTYKETDKGIQINYNNVGSFNLATQAAYMVPVDVSQSFTVKFRIDEPMGYHGLTGSPDVAYIFALTDIPGGWDLNDRTGSKGLYIYVRPEAQTFMIGNVGVQFGTVDGFDLGVQHAGGVCVSTERMQRPLGSVQELRIEVDEYGSYTMFLNGFEVTNPDAIKVLAAADPKMFNDGMAYLSITAHNGTGTVQNGQITIVEINGVRFTDVADEPWEELEAEDVLPETSFNDYNSAFVAKDWDVWIGANTITLNNSYTIDSFREAVYLGVGCELVFLDANGNEITDGSAKLNTIAKIQYKRYGELRETYTLFFNDIP